MIYAFQNLADSEVANATGGISGLFNGTPWIDIVGIGLVALFFILGLRHGLVWQVTRLIGMLVAVTLARSLSPEFAPHVESALSLPTKASQGIVWFLVFLATLLLTGLIGIVGRRALEAVHLGPMDRVGGGMAGAVTGVILHSALLVLLTAVGTTDWASRTLRGSASASMLDSLSRKSHLLLNAQAAEKIMEPWGNSYDAQQAEKQAQMAEMTRRIGLDKAEMLRRQADEEQRKAVSSGGPLPSNGSATRRRTRPSAAEARRQLFEAESNNGFKVK